MRIQVGLARAVAVSVLAATFGPASAQVTFTEFPDYALVNDMSAGGTVMVGVYDDAKAATVFRWTAPGGIELETFDDGTNVDSMPIGVSADGRTIVGWDFKPASLRPDPGDCHELCGDGSRGENEQARL